MLIATAAFAATPLLSTLPADEDGPVFETRLSSGLVQAPELDGLDLGARGGLEAVWRPGMLRFRAGARRMALDRGSTVFEGSLQARLLDLPFMTLAPWVYGGFRVFDPPCEARCDSWSAFDPREPDAWFAGGLTAGVRTRAVGLRASFPVFGLSSASSFGVATSVFAGLPVPEGLSVDWRLHESFRYREGRADTVTLGGRLALISEEVVELDEIASPGVDLAWRHQRGDWFVEPRAGWHLDGPGAWLTLGFAPGTDLLHRTD